MKSLSQRSFSSTGYDDGVTSLANLIIKNASYLDTGYYSCYPLVDETTSYIVNLSSSKPHPYSSKG